VRKGSAFPFTLFDFLAGLPRPSGLIHFNFEQGAHRTIHPGGVIMVRNKGNNEKTSLIDLSDEELLAAYRNSIQNASWTPANYRKEMFWRSQERNTNAYNRWTSIIALATLINTIAIIVQLLKGLNVL